MTALNGIDFASCANYANSTSKAYRAIETFHTRTYPRRHSQWHIANMVSAESMIAPQVIRRRVFESCLVYED